MKKFYSVFLFLTVLLLVGKESYLQGTCSPNRKVFHVRLFSPSGIQTMVYVEGFYSNSPLTIFNAALNAKLLGNTDAGGSGSFIYSNFSPVDLAVNTLGLPACTMAIPSSVGCPAILPPLLRVTYSTVSGPICCIYTRIVEAGEEIRVFDAAGSLIPVVTNNDPSLQIGDLVCFQYPCDRSPNTITVNSSLGSCSRPVPQESTLPVKLTSFTAHLQDAGTVSLNWISVLEIGSEKYIVEKSADGRNFSSIGEVASAGNSTQTQTYQFDDLNFSSGIAFYRLKQVDIDGQFEYSKVVYVNNGVSSSELRVFPNPFKDDLQLIGIKSTDIHEGNLQVYTLAGMRVGYKLSGANAISLDPAAPAGVYILKFKGRTFKLIKQE